MGRLKLLETDEILPVKPRITRRVRKAVDSEKDEIIARKDKRIDYLMEQNNKLRKSKEKQIQRSREQRDRVVKKVNSKIWQRKKENFIVTQKQMNDRAREIYNDKLKLWMLKSTNFIDGITAFATISEMLREREWRPRYYALFVIIAHHNWFMAMDAVTFGFTYKNVFYWLDKLRHDGLIEKFTGRKHSYVLSVKGQMLFAEIKKEHKKRNRILIKGFNENLKRVKGWTNIKVRVDED